MSITSSIKARLTSTPALRFVFGALRTVRPIAIFGKKVFVTRYQDVADVLVRENDFTVHEIDGYKMEIMGNPFILGMDASPETTRDRNLLRQVIKREDLTFIREFIKSTANELIAASAGKGRINVVNEYARLASVRLVANYFGVPADEKTMMRWQRAIFNEAFINLDNDPAIHERGMIAAKEVADHLMKLILERQLQNNTEDNVLNRIIAKKKDNPWLDDVAVRRNILCMLGVVENTSKVVTHVIDQLLRRPAELQKAKAAAISGDIETVKKYSFEALRFNPHNPAILRYCKNGAILGKGTKHERRIPPETTVYAATLSAMFDPGVMKKPRQFDPERNVECFHFGHGPHLCTGRYISEVTVPELVAGLLRLKNLRRAKGKEGFITYDQKAFPEQLILEFDANNHQNIR